MPDRVVVFLDYQNVYMGARKCFHDWHDATSQAGQIDPIKLGEHLVAASPYDRELVEVRIYRGRPDSSKQPKGYGACTRQCDTWGQDPRNNVTLRTLAYPRGWPDPRLTQGEKPREKGIDVALAIDYVVMAVEKRYDVGVLMSTDTDLKPALEAVAVMTPSGGPRAEVAAWSSPNGGHNRRLSIPGKQLWCHWLDEGVYTAVADLTDYTVDSG